MAIKYKWLAERLRIEIQKQIAAGQPTLPTEAAIGARFQVSRQTVRQALAILEEEGLIERRQGSGSFITGLSSDPEYNQIHILISDQNEYRYPLMLSKLRELFSKNGFSLCIHETHQNVSEERLLLQQLLDKKKKPKGLLVEGCKTALPNPNLDLYRRVMASHIPLVFLSDYYPALEGSIFCKDDNLQGMNLLLQQLSRQGHTHIGAILPWDQLWGQERYQALVSGLNLLGLPFEDSQVGWYSYPELANLEKTKNRSFLLQLYRKQLSQCSAIIASHDEIAYGLSKALRKEGISIPKDVALVSFDNSYLCDATSIGITSLGHTTGELWERAAGLLLGQIKGLSQNSVELGWTLVSRQSS